MGAEAKTDPINLLTERIIGCCIEVHREIGPGLLESIYEECLWIALKQAGLRAERQGSIPITFRGVVLANAFRFDLLVEGQVLVELKSVEAVLPVHKAQVISYLRLCGFRVGLLVNFNVPTLRQGLHRLVSRAPDLSAS